MKKHIVKKGETLSSIAALYYADSSKYLQIYNANGFLKGRSKGNLSDEDLILPGESLLIPNIDNLSNIPFENEKSKLQIEIGGKIFYGWTGVTIDLNLDEIADTFAISIGYESLNQESTILKPFGYDDVRISFGNNVILTGIIPYQNIVSSSDGNNIDIHGYSKTGILKFVNLAPNQYPRKFEDMSLTEISQKLIRPFGSTVIISNPARGKSNLKYNEVEIGETESIGSFLSKLAKDRSLILGNTPQGDLLIDKLVGGKKESLSVNKPTIPNIKNSVTYDGDALSSDYFLVQTGDEETEPSTSVFKSNISQNRPKVFVQRENSSQNNSIKIANEAKKALSMAQKISSGIIGWTDDNNELIAPGSVFTVKDPVLKIPETQRYIIKSVTLTTAPSGGRQAEYSGVLEESIVAV